MSKAGLIRPYSYFINFIIRRKSYDKIFIVIRLYMLQRIGPGESNNEISFPHSDRNNSIGNVYCVDIPSPIEIDNRLYL
jgi:hypothetical protein